MLTSNPTRFVGGPAIVYKPRFASAQWDTHKADIVREYNAHGITYTREWMRENRGFDAT